jgi:hypothetical protein
MADKNPTTHPQSISFEAPGGEPYTITAAEGWVADANARGLGTQYSHCVTAPKGGAADQWSVSIVSTGMTQANQQKFRRYIEKHGKTWLASEPLRMPGPTRFFSQYPLSDNSAYASASGKKGGRIGGRHCPNGFDGQYDTRYLDANGQVYSIDTHHSEEENIAIAAKVGELHKTEVYLATWWTSGVQLIVEPSGAGSAGAEDIPAGGRQLEALLSPSPCSPMGLRNCSRIDDEEVNRMMIKAITSGATTVGKAADSTGVTKVSLGSYCKMAVRHGRASWMDLKTMYKPQKPGKQPNQKKRKKK